MKTTLSLLLISLLVANNTLAGAYMFPELGGANISTAGAGAQAVAEGAETAYANSAAMTKMSEPTIAFNVQGMVSDIQFTDTGSDGLFAGGESSTQAGSAMPAGSVYYVAPLNDKWSAGIALVSAGGSVIDYGADFSGAILLQDAMLITAQLNPSIAYKVNDNLSLGVGVVAEYGMLEQRFAGTDKFQIEATGSSLEFGYTASALYEFNDKHRVGFSYRSEIEHDMEGDLTLSNQRVDSSVGIIMPANATMSGFHQLTDKASLLWSLGWMQFSSVETTNVTLDSGVFDIQRQWEDTVTASIGGYYQLNEQWRLEGGVSYETSPQDDPTMQYPDVPTGELWKYAVGATYEMSHHWRFNVYYEYLDVGQPSIEYALADSTLRGEYNANIHFFGVMTNYRF
ncbi:OmpP1/FadL family transporter [Shewanella waksmanii]|uniref:OmpP1/FadL family transporter n=1 Tax=Shewanella waksmanii TaxID=213783 RepID=UPI00048E63DE|nr:outer membrane protein transport protein [Shewanella waksmanii]